MMSVKSLKIALVSIPFMFTSVAYANTAEQDPEPQDYDMLQAEKMFELMNQATEPNDQQKIEYILLEEPGNTGPGGGKPCEYFPYCY